jgi:hypothetical protein
MARSLRSPNITASYSTMLWLHLSVSVVNCMSAAYLSLMLEGDIEIAAALTLVLPQLYHNTPAMGCQSLGPQCNLRSPSSLQ